MTSKEAAPKPQEIKVPSKVNVSTLILSVALTFFMTIVLTTVLTWFLFGSIHTEARAAVVQDMTLVSKSVEQ